MRKLVVLGLVATLAAAGFYAVQALYFWEWTRAAWMTTAFVAVEVALVGVLVLGRLRALGTRLDALEGTGRQRPAPRALEHLQANRPPAPARFAWLDDTMRGTNVFVTMLVAGGALMSAALWLVDRIARATVSPAQERQLAHELDAIAFPADGLVPSAATLLATDLEAGERPDLDLLLTGGPGHRR